MKTPNRINTTPVPEESNMEELSGDINKKTAEISTETDGDVSFTRSGKVRNHSDRRNVSSPSRSQKTIARPLNVENDMPNLSCDEIIHFNDPNMSQQFLDFFNNKR